MMEHRLDNLLHENKGILRTADALAAGITKDRLYRFAQAKGLEKVAQGLFIDPSAWGDMAILQAQFPKAVFSHETALYLHDLAEMEPMPLTVTVPAKYNSPKLMEKGVRIAYVKPDWHSLGVCEATTPGGLTVRTYNMERTICDIIRKRNEVDVAAFNYALRAFVRRKGKDLNRLIGYAKTMRMEKLARNTLSVLL